MCIVKYRLRRSRALIPSGVRYPRERETHGGCEGNCSASGAPVCYLAQGSSLMLPTLAESKSHQPCPVLIFVLSCDRDFTPDRNRRKDLASKDDVL